MATPPRQSLLAKDLSTLKRWAKRAWWLGMLLGLMCHLVPPDYQAACHAVINACKP